MMDDGTSSLKKSINPLDKYHILTKEWKDNMEGKVGKNDNKAE